MYKVNNKISYIKSSEVQDLDDAYLFLREKDCVHSLNYTAGRVLEEIYDCGDLKIITEVLSSEFEVNPEEILEDIKHIINVFLERDWIENVD